MSATPGNVRTFGGHGFQYITANRIPFPGPRTGFRICFSVEVFISGTTLCSRGLMGCPVV